MSDTVHKHVSKPSAAAEVQRFEVFTGAGRRRRWPAELKAQIVAESERGGETVTAVARRHGLTVPQLFAWRRQAREGVLVPAANPAGFVPIEIEPRRASGGPPMIEVAIGQAVLRVPPGIDAGTLAMVLRALRQHA